jgi:predicted ester cyclase
MSNETDNHINIVNDYFFNKIWNEKDLSVADNLFTDEFITESIAFESGNWVSMHGTGPNSMKHHVNWWFLRIPDAKMRVIDIAASDNKVITNWELRGTIQGEIFGVNPKNQEVTILGCTISIFEGDKIRLNRTLFDVLGFLQQINILPPIAEILKKE